MQVQYITVGKIRSPHGTKGDVKIIGLTDFPSRFKPGITLYISPPLPQIEQLVVESARLKAEEIILKFVSVDTRQQAENLRGRMLQIPMSEAENLAEGSYWQFQIIGLEVFTTDNVNLGRISEILRTGANDVYVIKSAKSDKDILIPAVKEVVKTVNLQKRILVIEPLPGLIEED